MKVLGLVISAAFAALASAPSHAQPLPPAAPSTPREPTGATGIVEEREAYGDHGWTSALGGLLGASAGLASWVCLLAADSAVGGNVVWESTGLLGAALMPVGAGIGAAAGRQGDDATLGAGVAGAAGSVLGMIGGAGAGWLLGHGLEGLGPRYSDAISMAALGGMVGSVVGAGAAPLVHGAIVGVSQRPRRDDASVPPSPSVRLQQPSPL